MAVGQTQLERAIYETKRGANVSQLDNGYMISTRERVIKEVRRPQNPYLVILALAQVIVTGVHHYGSGQVTIVINETRPQVLAGADSIVGLALVTQLSVACAL